jgi:hypothetical protein
MASTSAPIGQQGRVVVRDDVEGLGLAEGPGDESRVRLIQQAEPNLVRLRERGLRYKVQIVKDSLIPRVHQEQQLVTVAVDGFGFAGPNRTPEGALGIRTSDFRGCLLRCAVIA